jgi:hypothetical protein
MWLTIHHGVAVRCSADLQIGAMTDLGGTGAHLESAPQSRAVPVSVIVPDVPLPLPLATKRCSLSGRSSDSSGVRDSGTGET